MISIHAPSRERLGFSTTFSTLVLNFNPRSLAGATSPPLSCPAIALIFQSTLPRGSDFQRNHLLLQACYFNPRSLAGATIHPLHVCHPNLHFNPRSLAGATVPTKVFWQHHAGFQSTLPRGSD